MGRNPRGSGADALETAEAGRRVIALRVFSTAADVQRRAVPEDDDVAVAADGGRGTWITPYAREGARAVRCDLRTDGAGREIERIEDLIRRIVERDRSPRGRSVAGRDRERARSRHCGRVRDE